MKAIHVQKMSTRFIHLLKVIISDVLSRNNRNKTNNNDKLDLINEGILQKTVMQTA